MYDTRYILGKDQDLECSSCYLGSDHPRLRWRICCASPTYPVYHLSSMVTKGTLVDTVPGPGGNKHVWLSLARHDTGGEKRMAQEKESDNLPRKTTVQGSGEIWKKAKELGLGVGAIRMAYTGATLGKKLLKCPYCKHIVSKYIEMYLSEQQKGTLNLSEFNTLLETDLKEQLCPDCYFLLEQADVFKQKMLEK